MIFIYIFRHWTEISVNNGTMHYAMARDLFSGINRTACGKSAEEADLQAASNVGILLEKAAAKIATYVHATMTPDPGIAALRTAGDINKERRGVCRDYTTFFTAIARAAGIPTRQCTGIAYVNGQFLYHAWPEVWVGEDSGWVALEPTWGRPYADATHIKLAQGEITDVYRIADDMGKYKIEVLDAK